MTTRQPPDATAQALPAVDTSLRFVRVLERRPDGQVSFEFSIGWPELAVELMLPAQAFDDFCRHNQVRHLALQTPDLITTTPETLP